MARAYYYFAASLTHLQFGAKEPQPVEVFLKDCERLMDPQDYLCVKSVIEGTAVPSGNRTAAAWIKFEHDLRNELAFQRAEKKAVNPAGHIRGTRDASAQAREIVGQALKAANPLEGEKFIDAARWQYLEELAVGQQFNFDYILIYAVKLKILERYHHLESPRAKDIFEKIKNVDDLLIGLI